MGPARAASRLLLGCIWWAAPVCIGKKPTPVAVEAQFKARITEKVKASLALGSAHLAWILGISDNGVEGGRPPNEFPDAFRLYELNLTAQASAFHYYVDAGKYEGHWKESCANSPTDSVSFCALRKLQALTALCDVEGAGEKYRAGITAVVKMLTGKRDQLIAGLQVKRAKMPLGDGTEAWLFDSKPGEGRFDVLPSVHAAAMLATVRCAGALGKPDYYDGLEGWFESMKQMYPRSEWSKQSYHVNSILWESFVLITETIRSDSSFAEHIREFIAEFESYLQAEFDKDKKVWSFSAANALVLSLQNEKSAKRRKRLGKAIDSFRKRWVSLAPQLNASTSYMCGPMQGVVPLVRNWAAEHVSDTLAIVEKDIDGFQIHTVADDQGAREMSNAAGLIGEKVLAVHNAKGSLEGAFFRDRNQMFQEKRFSMRIDDTSQCVVTLTRTLQLLNELIGVDVPMEQTSVPDTDVDDTRESEL